MSLIPLKPYTPLPPDTNTHSLRIPNGKSSNTYKIDRYKAGPIEFKTLSKKENTKLSLLDQNGKAVKVGNTTANATGRDATLKLENLPKGTYYVQASLPEVEFYTSGTPTLEGGSNVMSMKVTKKPDSNVTYLVPHQKYVVVDIDGNKRNGWDTKITVNPGDWNKKKEFTIYVDPDQFSKDLPANQTERAVFAYRGTESPSTFVGGGAIGAVTNTTAPTETYDIVLDFKADLDGYWTPEKRQALRSAADGWAFRILDNNVPAYAELEVEIATGLKVPVRGVTGDLYIVASSSPTLPSSPSGDVLALAGVVATRSNGTTGVGVMTVNTTLLSSYNLGDQREVMIHELAHVFGLVGFNSIGLSKINTSTSVFTGEDTVLKHGQNLPLASGLRHVDSSVPSSVTPSVNEHGDFNVPFPIDFALLKDHGYNVSVPN